MKLKHTVYDKFFKDKNGKVVITQPVNPPIVIWAVASIANFFIDNANVSNILSALGTAAIIVWAAAEILSGVNYFRRLLGLAVLLITLL